MRRLLFAGLIVAAMASLSEAMWAYVPLEALVQESELIVVGTLSGVSEFSSQGMDYGEGVILVEDVIWGQVTAGETLTLRWQNRTNVVCPRVDHSHAAGKKGIWLLTVKQDHEVNANYPGRFVELEERNKVAKALSKSVVCLITSDHWARANQPAPVSLIFRNPTDKPLEFPGIEVSGNNVMLSSDLELVLHHIDWRLDSDSRQKKVEPFANLVAILPSTQLAPLVVAPGDEHRIPLDLRRLFPLTAGQSYTLELKVKGHRRGNVVSMYATTEADEEEYPRRPAAAAAKSGKAKQEPSRALLILPGVAIFFALFTVHRRRRRT